MRCLLLSGGEEEQSVADGSRETGGRLAALFVFNEELHMETFENCLREQAKETERADRLRRKRQFRRAFRREQAGFDRGLRRMIAGETVCILLLLAGVWLILAYALGAGTADAARSPEEAPGRLAGDETPATEYASLVVWAREEPETAPPEDFENEKIEAALYETGYFRADVPLDAELQSQLRAACEESGVEYELMLAVIRKETGYRNVMGDGGNSYGYCQVQPRWHKARMARLGVTDLMDPYGNFRVACDYMAELLSRYDTENALTAYNSGHPGHSEYAATVMGYWEELKKW